MQSGWQNPAISEVSNEDKVDFSTFEFGFKNF